PARSLAGVCRPRSRPRVTHTDATAFGADSAAAGEPRAGPAALTVAAGGGAARARATAAARKPAAPLQPAAAAQLDPVGIRTPLRPRQATSRTPASEPSRGPARTAPAAEAIPS